MLDGLDQEHFLEEARQVQLRLAPQVIRTDAPPFRGTYVTGVDVAYSERVAVGCAVTIDLTTMEPVDHQYVETPPPFPYVSGFFHLREGPILIDLIGHLQYEGPILIDGHGILHPRRCGLASYVGVTADVQTIGVAKRPMLQAEERVSPRGIDQIIDGEVLGTAIRLSATGRPTYVSIGHRISLETAVEVVRGVARNGRIEPIHLAHLNARKRLRDLCQC